MNIQFFEVARPRFDCIAMRKLAHPIIFCLYKIEIVISKLSFVATGKNLKRIQIIKCFQKKFSKYVVAHFKNSIFIGTFVMLYNPLLNGQTGRVFIFANIIAYKLSGDDRNK